MMQWNEFDANKTDAQINQLIENNILQILKDNKIKKVEIKKYAEKIIKDYKQNLNDDLNQTIGIQVFRPHEFDNTNENDPSLKYFTEWIIKQTIDWRKGSETIKNKIKDYFNSSQTKIQFGETHLMLDNLIEIDNRNIAIEIETSGNIDNGFYKIRQSIKKKIANYGIMITPWCNKPNCADEKKARERLDNEFDGKIQTPEGPIYSLTILRLFDIFLEMEKRY